MEFTKNQLEQDNQQQQQVKVPIPEGDNTLWITKFKTVADEDTGQKRKFNNPRGKKNIKMLDYNYKTEVELADKDKTGNILTAAIWWNEQDKVDYIAFATAGQADLVTIDEGKKTERYRMEPENRADDDTLPGIVGRAVEVHVTHIEKDLALPKKDEAGNQAYGPDGRWLMEIKRDEDGNPIKYIQEYITRDSNWRLVIKKSDNKELFFLDDDDSMLDLPEPTLSPEQQSIINNSSDGQPF